MSATLFTRDDPGAQPGGALRRPLAGRVAGKEKNVWRSKSSLMKPEPGAGCADLTEKDAGRGTYGPKPGGGMKATGAIAMDVGARTAAKNAARAACTASVSPSAAAWSARSSNCP